MKLVPGGRVNVFTHRSATGEDFLIASYRADGTRRWQWRFSSLGDHVDAASALAVDALGRTYVAGSMYRGSTGDDIAAICIVANGDLGSQAFLDGVSSGDDAARDVVVSPTSV